MDTPPRVSDTELAILDVLWNQGEVQARAITEALYPNEGRAKSATVHSLLERLERKQLVERNRESYPHQFRARVDREAYVATELRRMAGQVFSGDLAPLLLNLAGEARLSEAERRRIVQLLDRPRTAEDEA